MLCNSNSNVHQRVNLVNPFLSLSAKQFEVYTRFEPAKRITGSPEIALLYDLAH